MRTPLVVLCLICLANLACATWVGHARRVIREPGQKLLDLPEEVEEYYACAGRDLPHLELERNELNPNRIQPGGELNHRIVYALCPRRSTEVVTGTLTTQVRFRGRVVVRERVPDFEFKPGRWSVDSFVKLPEAAEAGIYALEIRFEGGPVRLAESLTFGVDG